MVGSEAVPYAKTGGLADVLGALPRALARLGHQVDVMMPRYRRIHSGERLGSVEVALDGATRTIQLTADDTAPGVRTIFVEAPEYFDRDHLYGTASDDYADNATRFALLAYAAQAWAATPGSSYDVA